MNTNNDVKPMLLKGAQVADALNVSRALAYRWMSSGILPTVRVSKSIRVPRLALEKWIETNTQHPAA